MEMDNVLGVMDDLNLERHALTAIAAAVLGIACTRWKFWLIEGVPQKCAYSFKSSAEYYRRFRGDVPRRLVPVGSDATRAATTSFEDDRKRVLWQAMSAHSQIVPGLRGWSNSWKDRGYLVLAGLPEVCLSHPSCFCREQSGVDNPPRIVPTGPAYALRLSRSFAHRNTTVPT